MRAVSQRVFAAPGRGDGHNGLGIAGDCMRACIASILDLDYADVPHFCHYGDGHPIQKHPEHDDPFVQEHGALWWRRYRRWLREWGMDAICIDSEHEAWDHALNGWALRVPKTVDTDPPLQFPWPCDEGRPWVGDVIVAGDSPRGPFGHVVVGRYDGHRPPGERLDIVHDPHPSRAGITAPYSMDIITVPYDPPPPAETWNGEPL